MKLPDETVCDGCQATIPPDAEPNLVTLNNATYDLCWSCYHRLLDFFNREITI